MGTVPVGAGARDSRAIKRSMAILAAGRVLGIFPEGRRSEDGTIGEARPGAALIAALSGAPVIPVFIDGARESLPVGGRFPAPARVHVRFGPALRFVPAPGGRRDRGALDEFASRVEAAIRRLEPVA
jgi:1-acyl-sn-glycerol-3-phosphate acyltransferase